MNAEQQIEHIKHEVTRLADRIEDLDRAAATARAEIPNEGEWIIHHLRRQARIAELAALTPLWFLPYLAQGIPATVLIEIDTLLRLRGFDHHTDGFNDEFDTLVRSWSDVQDWEKMEQGETEEEMPTITATYVRLGDD